MLNKPKGFINFDAGWGDKQTVQELIRSKHPEKVPPIGDMGRTVTGLLLLTNDDKLRQKMTGKFRYNIIYQVILEQNTKTADLDALTKGVRIRDKFYKIKSVAYIKGRTKNEIGIEASNISPGILKKILEQRSLKLLTMDRTIGGID